MTVDVYLAPLELRPHCSFAFGIFFGRLEDFLGRWLPGSFSSGLGRCLEVSQPVRADGFFLSGSLIGIPGWDCFVGID